MQVVAGNIRWYPADCALNCAPDLFALISSLAGKRQACNHRVFLNVMLLVVAVMSLYIAVDEFQDALETLGRDADRKRVGANSRPPSSVTRIYGLWRGGQPASVSRSKSRLPMVL